MTKDQEIMNYLHQHVFDPILNSAKASKSLKKGVRYTIMRLDQRDATGKVKYFYSAIAGTDRSKDFAWHMEAEGFKRFEDIQLDFRSRFDYLLAQ